MTDRRWSWGSLNQTPWLLTECEGEGRLGVWRAEIGRRKVFDGKIWREMGAFWRQLSYWWSVNRPDLTRSGPKLIWKVHDIITIGFGRRVGKWDLRGIHANGTPQ